MQGAFLAGLLLLTAVLTIPALHGFFAVKTLGIRELVIVYGLSGSGMLVIQMLKYLTGKNYSSLSS